ncbi:C39 family peptidase [Methylophaga sp.]|uniref:C39 family peptidase n=1 Tax=Methylophaga sp. TaxID=2024840 RepID=UPI0025F0F1BD|nr:C39 family peptidase [Methylophaga sp.]
MNYRKSTLLFITASGLWLSMSLSSAANIYFGGVIPGTLINKNIISMRERHFLDMVPQRTDFSCGAAALATILNYAYGYKFSEAEVIAGMLKVSDPQLVQNKGFSLLDIKNYVETLGLRGRGYTVNPEILDRIKIPTIVLLDIRGYKHFVVLKKTTPDKVYIADPALGNRVMDRQNFVDGWNKVTFAVIGNGFDRETILLRPKPPLTARNTVDTWRPLTDAELVEFGFYRSELF